MIRRRIQPCFLGVAYVLAIVGKHYASVKPGAEATKMVAKNWLIPAILLEGIGTCGENVPVTAAFW
jgi:hypothetical protein